MFDRPAPVATQQQPRFAVVATGEVHHGAEIDNALESRNRIAYQQRILLPMVAQERRGGQSIEQRVIHAQDSIVYGQSPGPHGNRIFEIG
jgi:hypothetical protein